MQQKPVKHYPVCQPQLSNFLWVSLQVDGNVMKICIVGAPSGAQENACICVFFFFTHSKCILHTKTRRMLSRLKTIRFCKRLTHKNIVRKLFISATHTQHFPSQTLAQ